MRTEGASGVGLGWAEVWKPDVANKMARMRVILWINAEHFDVLHDLRHKSTLECNDMVEQLFI